MIGSLKTLLIILGIVILLGVAVVLVGVSVNWNWSNFASSFKKDVRNEQTLIYDETVNEIEISAVSDNISFQLSPDGKIRIQYYDSLKKTFAYSCENGRLSFAENDNWWNGLFSSLNNKTITVYVPAANYAKLTLKSVSGAIDADCAEINAGKLVLENTSGNVFLNNARANELKMNITSGNAEITDCIADTSEFVFVSGTVAVSDSEFENLSVNIVSGDIGLNNSTANSLNLNSTSGNTKAECCAFTNVDAYSVSGEIELNLNGNAQDYRFDISLTSGNFTAKGEGLNIVTSENLSYGTGEKLVKIKSVSGNVVINIAG